jgi:glucose-6-phosphate isomerase
MPEHRDIDLLYQNTSGVESPQLEAGQKALKDYVDLIWKLAQGDDTGFDYSYYESSVNLSLDEKFKAELLQKIKEKKNPELKFIIVIGIGGSNLGTMALYQALRGIDVFMHEGAAKLVFLDTVSPPLISQAVNFLNNKISKPEEIIVNMISKSGETTETVANFEVIYDTLKKKFGDKANDRLIFTTDKGSKLWSAAEQKGLEKIEIAGRVGGRYSVFSAVGLFPLGLAGFNVENFWAGAAEMVKRCTDKDVFRNPALVSAIISYIHYAKGFNIYNSFYFNPELKTIGRWYSQLLAESTGKEFDLDNKKVNLGFTPLISIGSTDLHSTATLFLSGPRNKFTQFIHASQKDGSPVLPSELFIPGLVNNIDGKSIADVMGAIFYGVKIAYLKNQLPYSEIVMHEISENSLGQYMQLKMIETMYLARLMNVNAFDQPKVEDYKRETRDILKKL